MICSVSYMSYYSCHMGLQNCTMECMIEVGPQVNAKWPEQKITNQNVAMVLKMIVMTSEECQVHAYIRASCAHTNPSAA